MMVRNGDEDDGGEENPQELVAKVKNLRKVERV